MTYEEQLRDPRWKKLRDHIVSCDGECRYCGSKEGLQCHHIKYEAGKMAWEYPFSNFITLCRRCHAMQYGIDLPRGMESRPVKTIRQVMVDAVQDMINKLKGK